MTSDRKTAANRQNSQHSTGPSSQAGKNRSRHNALRHGLAATLSASARSADVDRVATAICGKDAHSAQREQALIIAQCELMLLRVREAQLEAIEQMLPAHVRDQDTPHSANRLSPATAGELSGHEQLKRLDRYEHRALARRRRACALLHWQKARAL